MIQKITVENYKSLQSFDIELGRINVFIGANGSGKTNILEAIALAGAIADNKVAREVLVPRGIRWTEIEAMVSGFNAANKDTNIHFSVDFGNGAKLAFALSNTSIPSQKNTFPYAAVSPKLSEAIEGILYSAHNKKSLTVNELLQAIKQEVHHQIPVLPVLYDFLIYCPENTALRNFESEGQIEPLGIKGEGLFKHLLYLEREQRPLFDQVKEHLQLIDWYESFEIPNGLQFGEKRLSIKDRYIEDGLAYFDQRSANEGFLYLLFYLVLFVSPQTPSFFAIDNIDSALNPKLCGELVKVLSRLAKEHNKQVIMTTHNAALLDGLDLSDEEQRLFVIARNADGHTKAKRIQNKPLTPEAKQLPLSERFLRGYLGGLPKNF